MGPEVLQKISIRLDSITVHLGNSPSVSEFGSLR